jgi:hypothetical protein
MQEAMVVVIRRCRDVMDLPHGCVPDSEQVRFGMAVITLINAFDQEIESLKKAHASHAQSSKNPV